MLVCELRVGEEIVLARDVRISVLVVTGDQVFLGVTAPESGVVAPEAPERPTLRRVALTTLPSKN